MIQSSIRPGSSTPLLQEKGVGKPWLENGMCSFERGGKRNAVVVIKFLMQDRINYLSIITVNILFYKLIQNKQKQIKILNKISIIAMKTVRCARDFVVNDVTSIDQSERSNGTRIQYLADGGILTLSSDTEEDTQIRCVPRLL